MTDYDEYKDAIIFETEQGRHRLTVESRLGAVRGGINVYDRGGNLMLFKSDPDTLTALRDALNEILAEEAPLPADVASMFAVESDPQIRIEALRAATQTAPPSSGPGFIIENSRTFERYLTGEDVAA